MDIKRQPRLESLMEGELSKLISRELDIPPGTIVSVTNVELSSDLQNAKIGISVYPSASAEDIINKLKSTSGNLHYKLIRILNIRHVPALNFYLDKGIEHASTIEKRLLEDKPRD